MEVDLTNKGIIHYYYRGIVVFEEIIGRQRILMWLASASVAVVGILWLSYEHA